MPYNSPPKIRSMTTPGERIKKRRKELGFVRQGQFAKLVGVAQSTLSDIERGDSKLPSAAVLMRMAEVLKVTQAWIITSEDGEITIPTPQEQELLTKFRELDDVKRAVFLAFIASSKQ